MRQLIISVDFDGTIVKDEYPQIGPLLNHAKEALTRIHDMGHKIIINTCRCGDFAEAAKQFMEEWEVPYDLWNQNDPERVKAMGGKDPRKISADLYIDDHNFLGSPVNWDDIYKFIVLYGQDQFIPAVQVML